MSPIRTPGGEKTRDAIIEASYQLFTERGYHGTSMRDIAAQAGITAGSIYNHFSDKGEIIQAVILRYHPVLRVLPRLSEVEGASTEELISDAAHRIAKEVEADPGVLKLVGVELIDLGGKHVRELIGAMLPHVQRFLEKVYSSGNIARPPDPVIFFTAFVGILISYAFTRRFLDKIPYQPTSEYSLDTYIETFLWGVMRRGDQP
jgi:AcrR family transcriptional regulator